MKDLKLINGDLSVFNDDIEYVEEVEEVAQSAYIILQTELGEFKLDNSLGLNRENAVTKKFDAELIENDIATALLQDERITGIDTLDISSGDNRAYTAKLHVTIEETEIIEMEVEL